METQNKAWRVADMPLEDRLTQYMSLVNSNRKIPSLVIDNSDCDAVMDFCSRESILAILNEQGREPMIFTPLQERFNGKFLFVLRFQNPEEVRKGEREEKKQAREKAEIARGIWLEACWNKSDWAAAA